MNRLRMPSSHEPIAIEIPLPALPTRDALRLLELIERVHAALYRAYRAEIEGHGNTHRREDPRAVPSQNRSNATAMSAAQSRGDDTPF